MADNIRGASCGFSLGGDGETPPVTPDPEPVPEEITAIRFYPADGQSLEQAANIGTATAPDGRRWRDVLSSDRVRMLTGTVRHDGVVITHIASPTLGGYNKTIDPTGDGRAYAATSATTGLLTAFALADEYLPENTAVSYQFHSAAGMSVVNLDSSTAEGTTTVPWENAVFWMEKASAYYLANDFAVSCPGYGYNQGEADVGRPRGWWLQRFIPLVTERFAQIRTATGQAQDPILYLNQTGGYMNKTATNPHAVVLDQIDAVRHFGGILAVVNYALPIDNTDGRGVHLTVEGYAAGAYIRAWAIEETEQGRGWNLLPPLSVTRSGDTITIPISVRSDEALTTAAGKYASYGGDPANLGLEVVGGGSITSATVSGGNIVLQVSGTVTAVRYATQTTGIDYTQHTANNVGYATHRGLIRTTLTRQLTARGGMLLTLERWVPSFEVAVT